MPAMHQVLAAPPPHPTEPALDTQRPVGDEVRQTTCYMCACRCGINVHLKDGAIRYIEGNPDHPVNRGVLCAKGSAGIMQHYSPARLRKPMLRTGARGSTNPWCAWASAVQGNSARSNGTRRWNWRRRG